MRIGRIALALIFLALGILPSLIAEREPHMATKLGIYALEERKDYALMWEAEVRAKKAAEAIAERREALGYPIDIGVDPNRTGLIGLKFSEITTTLGDPVAKRTSVNPGFAALSAAWLGDMGLKAGDRVAIAASGSFPGLMIAVLAACEAMELEPVLVLSLGASEYGATIPELNAAQMVIELKRKGIFKTLPAAISLGGEKDSGESEFPGHETREALLGLSAATGLPLLEPSKGLDAQASLGEGARQRMDIYFAGVAPKVFVNIGGGEVAYGSTSASLRLPNGPIFGSNLRGGKGYRGLIFDFLDRGIPVIHFLNIKGLALRYGLPVDPVPFPEPGEAAFYRRGKTSKLPAVLGLAASLALLFIFRRRPDKRKNNPT
jgi:poly-gamma-glutamate system protein